MIASLGLGGAERQMAGLASALSLRGHEVRLFTYRNGDFYSDGLAGSGVEHIRIKGRGDLDIIRKAAALMKDCDMLISFLTGANIKACLVKRMLPDIRLVVSERTGSRRLLLHDRLRLQLYRRYADRVTCNNFTQEGLIRSGFPSLAPRLSVIPNFVDLDAFRPGPAETEGRDAGGPVRIIVTSRLCERKNAVGLIGAAAILFQKLLPFRIDWYGYEAEDLYLQRCRQAIRDTGLEGSFGIHPAVRDVARLYAEADIFCLPSYYEGTSNSLAEALACGLTAVCSRVSDNPRYVHEGVNGFLFNPADSWDMAAALERAISMQASGRRSFGLKGREIAERSFNINRLASAYESL